MTLPGYTLVVCEKPDAARKVADALAQGRVTSVRSNGVDTLEFRRGEEDYVVCSAIGHLYRVSDSFSGRDTFPVFDLEWYPANLVDKKLKGIQRRIASIRSIAKNAKRFINACDYDVEGETIGENILRYACGGKEAVSLRAKFSTLTKEEIASAFDQAKAGTGSGLANSGRTRHVLDFIWGINLSRALSTAVNDATSGYKTISMGRVQGPTLSFVVQKEVDIRQFLPTPYWTVTAFFEKDGIRFTAPSAKGKFLKRLEAEAVRASCEGERGMVSDLTKTVFKEPPPPPFNTGELQREAYRVFRYPPSRTLQIAERLYLDALISYPRTSSQRLPPSIGYRQILSKLAKRTEYATFSKELLEGSLSPREGEKDDRAHPAIYPTGEYPRRPLSGYEARVFDLIVRRFLACFGDDAVRERVNIRIDVKGNAFGLSGRSTLRSGWLKYYGRYAGAEDRPVPRLAKSDVVNVVGVNCEEKLELPPSRYNQSTLLDRMEKEGIGTKATRAETISTLVTRGYVTGDPIAATELGITVNATMLEHCPKMVSVELTRETEKELDEVADGRMSGSDVIERALTILSKQIEHLKSSEMRVGGELGQAAGQRPVRDVLARCPVCRTGNLVVIRSRKTGKRFVGCTNYQNGCNASAPLPQKGSIKAASQPCSRCGWPVVSVWRGRFPWRLCVNPSCPSKSGTKYAVQNLQKTS